VAGFANLALQTLYLSTKIRKLRTKKFYNIGPRLNIRRKSLCILLRTLPSYDQGPLL
jgi:hypothetical protein